MKTNYGSLLKDGADNAHHVNYDIFVNQEILENIKKIMEEGEARPEATFRIGITDFSKLPDTFFSTPCYIRNLPWKIVVEPKTFNPILEQKSLGVGFYVECHEESDSLPWSCRAFTKYKIISQREGIENLCIRSLQRFSNKASTWGFKHFMKWDDILDPEQGYIKRDIVIFEVSIRAEAPHGVNWDSKKHSGFVGIKTKGVLCNWAYVDSFLQILFFTNKLRKAIYQLPTEIDDSSLSYALGLQRVFYHLQFFDEPVGTKKLFKTLGSQDRGAIMVKMNPRNVANGVVDLIEEWARWDDLDCFMKYDAQELDRILLNNMQSKMKGTCAEGIIPQLFEGTMMSFVRCKNVNYTSERLEPFYDIQLNIKGNQNILESFKEYCAVETLEGTNKYHTEEYGFQDAEKGVIFTALPQVLRLRLSRFEYDPIVAQNTKIFDRFEFFEKLNLGKFLQSPTVTPAVYILHAVLIQYGDCEKGHYAVFINPKGDGKWYKFDEDVVSRCSKQDAIDYSFGVFNLYPNLPVELCSDACMLVYIKDSAVGDVLRPVTHADVPEQLAERLKEEKRQETILRQQRMEAHLYMNVRVVTSDDFCGHQDADLYNHEKVSYRVFKVKKESNIQQLTELIANQMNYHINMIRIWHVVYREETWRPMAIDTDDDLSESIFDIARNESPWTIFVESINPDSGIDCLPEFDEENDTLLFFKFYDPKSKRITYYGHKYMCIHIEASIHKDLVPVLNERAGFANDTNLMLFQELKPNVVKKMDLHLPLKKVLEELVNTHIIVFQKADNAADYEFPTVTEYFRYRFYRVEISFFDKLNPKDPSFTLELSFEMSYDQMVDAVSRRLNVDPYLLLFFKSDINGDGPGSAIKSSFEGSLKYMLVFTENKKNKLLKKIYYQVMHVKINQLENKRKVKCKWLTNELQEEELTLYPNKNGRVADLLEEARKQVELSQNTSGILRLLKIISNKVIAVQAEGTPLDDLGNTDAITLRIEEVPREELVIADEELLIPIAHFHKEVFATFGIPFLLKIKNEEPFSQLMERIQKKLNVPVKEFEKFKFAIVIMGRKKYIEDTEALMNLTDFLPKNNRGAVQPRTWLGLDHANELPKNSKFNYFKKPILYR